MNDWKARAEREAAALIAAYTLDRIPGSWTHQSVQDVATLAWLQGAIFATHLDLQALEMGVDDLKAAL